jgi:hypothetical protein
MFRIATLSALALATALSACGDDKKKKSKKKKTGTVKTEPAKITPVAGEYKPQQEPLSGNPLPALVLSQAWFMKDAKGKSQPGPARLEIWRRTPAGWFSSLLEDDESNVFHKAIIGDDRSIITIGAMGANLKRWTYEESGKKWNQETLWSKSWGGKFDRLRDIEIGDVDGDGKDEYVIATHDSGVIAVYNPATEGVEAEIIEMDQKADTFVHEIEIGDIDGDGKLEFFATPSDRNKASVSQHGEVVMYKWDGKAYARSVVDPGEGTHAKEILAADIDGDGKSELFSVQEAVLKDKKMVKPVTIRQYTRNAEGSFSFTEIAQIQDTMTRFIIAEDFDKDGKKELIAAAKKTGLYRISQGADGWKVDQFDADSSSFEHAIISFDARGDGQPELYVAADNQQELNRYEWNNETKTFKKTKIGTLQPSVFTWNIASGKL